MTRTVKVVLGADVGDFKSKMREAGTAINGLRKELGEAARSGHMDQIGQSATIMGAGLTAAFGFAVKAAADFDKQMSAVSAATGANVREMASLKDAALEAGKSTQYSATEAAKGITELGKAGVSTEQILSGGLNGALSLAAAGQMDVAKASEVAASAMTQFKLSGDKVPHVADLLAGAANNAQGSVSDLGYALGQTGLIAGQQGWKIEETTAVLASFASAGLLGSDAGTSLKTALSRLSAPTKEVKSALEDLGIQTYDANGKFLSAKGIAGQLQTKLADLSEEQRNTALNTIFGSDAIRAGTILMQQGAQGVEDWTKKIDKAGYAQKTAAELTDNLAGDIERLKGSLETLAIQAGGGASDGLRGLAQSANFAVDAFSELPSWIQTSTTYLAGIGGVTLLASGGFVKARSTAKDFMGELREMGPLGTRAAGGLSKVASVAGKFGLIGAAVGGAYIGLELFSDWAEKRTGPTKANIDKLTESISAFAATGKATGELASKYGENLERIGGDVNAVITGMKQLDQVRADVAAGLSDPSVGENWDPVDPQVQQRITDLDTALTSLVNSGGASQAVIFLRNLQGSGKLTADQFTELTRLLPGYENATKAATTANTGLAQGFGTAQSNASTMTTSLSSATEAGQKLTDVWNQLNGAVLGTDKANLSAVQAIDKVKESFKANGLAIEDNSEKALTNRVAIGEAAKAAAEAAQAKFEETGSVTDASKTYDTYISQLRKALKEAGLNKKQVDELIGSYGQMPPSVSTGIKQPGMPAAITRSQELWDKLKGVDGDWVANLKLKGYASVKADLLDVMSAQYQLEHPNASKNQVAEDRREKGRFFDVGGWTGPGAKYDVAGVVHADEFVIKKSARQQIEAMYPGLLSFMNSTGQVPKGVGIAPGYAAGGVVMPFPVDVSKTKIPAAPAMFGGPTGNAGPAGMGWEWMVAAVHKAFPGMAVLSTFRKNSRTLSGNRSYHASGRAVDFSPSKPLAEWVNANYFDRTKELITPWKNLNIHNGKRHGYSGDVYAQHAGTGRFKGNAHDHWAMFNGGVIPEPVVGVGLSGRTYSFGENGPERVVPGYAGGGLVNVAAPTGGTSRATGSKLDTAEALLSARSAVAALSAALKENGRSWSTATQKGRDNRNALISGIKAAQDAARAKYAETGSVKAANKVYDDYLQMLNRTLQLGGNSESTRRSLLKQYSQRPSYDLPTAAAPSNSSNTIAMMQGRIGAQEQLESSAKAFAWTKPTFASTSETGRAELNQLFSFLSAAQQAAQSTFEFSGSSKQAMGIYDGYIGQLRSILGRYMSKTEIDKLLQLYGRITLTSNRWGGLYEHAATGSLRDAQIAGGGPTQYAWAEASTGGELFAPKNGNLSKTRSEVGWAVANWWGGAVNWQPGNGGGQSPRTVVVDATIPITIGAETITRQIRLEVDTAIGQVANATVYQTA